MKALLSILLVFFTLGACTNSKEKVKKNSSISHILKLASLAPSSHNAQMWKVDVISDYELLVSLDKDRLLPSSDKDNIEALISLGAFLENMIEAAKFYQLDSKIYYSEKEKVEDSSIKVQFFKKEFDNNSQMLKNIKERHSIKEAYLNKNLEEVHIKKLIVSENVRYFEQKSNEGKYIKNTMYKGIIYEARNDNIQNELSDWIRTSYKEEKNTMDGIRPDQMGISGIKKFLFYTFINKKSLNSDKFIEAGIKKGREQIENSSGYFLVEADGNSFRDIVNIGRTLEELWLNATEEKVAVQIMSQINHNEALKKKTIEKLDIKNEVFLILRAGYVKNYGKSKSLRRNIDQFATYREAL